MDTKYDIPNAKKYRVNMAEKKWNRQREEKDMVKRKKDQYLLDHRIPIHSPKGPIITTAPLAPTAMPRFLLAVLAGLQGKQHIH
jgi:hypothetical protein